MRDNLGNDVLVIDWKTAGELPQPFEQFFNENIVVFPDRVEHRQFENLELGMTRYVIHTETFRAGHAVDPELFLGAFKRAYREDPVDIRKAIRWALKGSYVPPDAFVVG